MRKITTALLTGSALLLFTACGSSGGSSSDGGNIPAPPTTVNLIGTWDYSMATSGSICDGLVAQGVEIVEAYNGDNSVIGNIIMQGTTFDIDSRGNCYLAPLDTVDTSSVGIPSNLTKDEYIGYFSEKTAGIGTIESFEVINYNANIVSSQINVVNNVTIYSDLTRQ